jgi:hypothetical protein
MTDLPEELWLKIFSGVRSGVHPENCLAALCRVSSKFHRIAQPLLYQSIDGESRLLSPLFFRTLCSRPDLGQLTRSLDIGSYIAEPEEAVYDAFKAAQGTLGLPAEFEARIMDGLEKGIAESQIALGLVLVPNIDQLDLAVPYEKDHILAAFNMAREHLETPTEMPPKEGNVLSTPPTPKIFSRLREISLRHWDTEGAIRMWEITQMFAFSTLETLHGFATDWCDTMPQELEGTRLALKHITLEYSLIDSEGLSSLFRLFPELHSVKIEWGPATVGDCDMDFGAMGGVLRRQGNNLQALSLDPRESFAYEYGDATGCIGSLQAMRKLKELEIPLDVLIGKAEDDDEEGDDDEDGSGNGAGNTPLQLHEVLPASLEFLHISSDEGDRVQSHLRTLVASGHAPNLSKIEIDFIESGPLLDIEEFGWVATNKRHTVFTKKSV